QHRIAARMRFALVSSAYWPLIAGVSAYTTTLAQGLAARGHDVHAIVPYEASETVWGPSTEASRERVDGVDVHRVERMSGALRLAERLARLRGGWRASRALLRLPGLGARPWSERALPALCALAPDVTVVVDWFRVASVRPILLGRQAIGGACVGIPLFHTEEAWARAPAYDALFAGCDALILNTEHEREFVARRLVERAGPRPELHVVSPGIDPARFAHVDGRAVRARLGLGDAPVVGYVGRLEPAKGVP